MTRKIKGLDFIQIFSKSHANTGARVTSALKIAQDILLGLVIKISNQSYSFCVRDKNLSVQVIQQDEIFLMSYYEVLGNSARSIGTSSLSELTNCWLDLRCENFFLSERTFHAVISLKNIKPKTINSCN